MPNVKRKMITSPDQYLTLLTYIHLNPVSHQFVEHASDWHYSSYQAYLSEKPTKISRNEGLSWAGGSAAFLKLHEAVNIEKLEKLSLIES